MPLARREFLIASAAWLASGCRRATEPAPALRGPNLFLGGGRYRESPEAAVRYVFAAIDIDSTGAVQRYLTATDFLPHGLHIHPQEPQRLALFQKKGPGACEYDLDARRVIRPIPVTGNRHFYGHGCYSADGAVLLSTEANLDNLDGAIGIRDSRTLAYLGAFPSYGKSPHECQLIDDGRTLVVTNGGDGLDGDAPCVSYIDVASQRLLERVPPSDARINTGHFAVTRDHRLVVVSAPRSGLDTRERGGISLRTPRGGLQTLSEPAAITRALRGEALSVAIHEARGIVAVTHPDADLLTFWSLRERTLLQRLSLPRPRGLTLTTDQSEFIVSAGEQASLLRIPAQTLTPLSEPLIALSYVTGSHLYNWTPGHAAAGASIRPA
jgi:hypothetical protein